MEKIRFERKFTLQLDTVFAYPFSSFGGGYFLVFMTPFWAVLRSGRIPFGIILQVLVGGYIAGWMWSVLYDTSMGKPRAPGPPSATDLSELVGSFFRFFGANLAAFAPTIALVIYGIAGSAPSDFEEGPFSEAWFIGAVAATALLGALYYPMTLLLIGFSESWFAAFNVVFGLRSILRIKGDYLICCLFFIATFGASTALEFFWVASTQGAGLLPWMVASGVTTFVELVLYAIQMRALGLLYACNKDRLAWFR